MKCYLTGHPYQYAVEQTLLMLFPGQRPKYPHDPPAPEEPALFSNLILSPGAATAYTTLQWNGGRWTAEQTASLSTDLAPTLRERVLQNLVKQSFFHAATQATGIEPEWGSLTGVRPVKLPTRAMRQGATAQEARQELEQFYHVSPRRGALAMDCARASLDVERTLCPDEVSLYVGIPFCPSRCSYCSFVSADIKGSLGLVEPYLAALAWETAGLGAMLRDLGIHIRTLYIGGGTPTTLSAAQLDALLTALETHLPLSRCSEMTVEAGRPDTITREKLRILRQHQVGRISINPQTLEDPVLARIGRGHTARQTLEAYALAQEIGFDSINMDLIAGLPGDSFPGFCRSLDTVNTLKPENITVHTLALKKGAQLSAEPSAPAGAAEVTHMLDYTMDTLRTEEYVPYYLYRQKFMAGGLENVGWCKFGKKSVYNICMMEELQTVLSLGAGGISKLVDTTAGKIRRLNHPKYPRDYLSGLKKILSQKQELSVLLQGGI